MQSSTCRKKLPLKISIIMTIDLANISNTRLYSQNTRNGISGHQVFKMFWANNPLYPLGACTLGTCGIHLVIKKYPKFSYLKGWTVWDK